LFRKYYLQVKIFIILTKKISKSITIIDELIIKKQVKNRASRDFSLGWSFVNGYGCLIVNKY